MVFSSEVFLFLFLPVVYLLYLAIPNLKARNILLIVVSLVFYAYREPAFDFTSCRMVPFCGFSKNILKYRPLSDKIKGNGFICNIINERYEENEEDNGIVIGGVTGGRKLYNGFCC